MSCAAHCKSCEFALCALGAEATKVQRHIWDMTMSNCLFQVVLGYYSLNGKGHYNFIGVELGKFSCLGKHFVLHLVLLKNS